jgi:hypothetical protein
MDIPTDGQKIGTQADPDSALRELLKALLKHPSKSRDQIADEMSLYAGQRISKYMLDDWVRPGRKDARFPAFLIESLCMVIDDDRLQRHVMGARLRGILDLRDEQLAWLRGELLKPKPPRKAKGKRPRES